jgi:outer membrane protein assembly factor BamA
MLRMSAGVEKVDSRVEAAQHTEVAGLRQLRALLFSLLVAGLAALPLAAQQEQRVVRGLSFEGNRAFDDVTLSAVIATTNSSGFATSPLVRWMGLGEKRYFDELEFRRDVVRLMLFYRQAGYMNAAVDTVVRRTPKDVYIQFRIHEGEPVRVTKIDILGVAGILDVKKLRRELPLQVGDPFNRFLFQASADTVTAKLRNRGYPFAEVLRNFDSDAGALTAQVTLEALPGPHARIGEILVRGVEHVDTGTVLRVLSIRSNEPFNEDALYQSQRDLYGLGAFRSVSVSLADSVEPGMVRGSGDTVVRVLVRVAEGPRHGIRLGAGYGTLDCFRVQTGWVANNFLGGGRSLDLTGRVSKVGVGFPFDGGLKANVCQSLLGDATSDTLNYSAGATLTQPAFLSPRHSASLGVFAERRSEFKIYTRQSVGANTAVTFNARRAVPVTVGYTFSYGRTTASDASFCSLFRVCDSLDRKTLRDPRRFAAVTVSVVRDRVNSVLDPSEGSLVTVNLMHASHHVGSDPFFEFNRGELEIAHYYPMGRRTVFAWRVRGGTILPQNVVLKGERFVPPEQRFYAGGPNSVRGYGRNELGPRVYVIDTTNVVRTAPTGGNSVVVANVELRVPSPIYPSRVRIGLFVDAGQVWERGQEPVTLRSVRVTPGVGLRFATPLGPVRLDFAYNGYPAQSGPLLLDDGTGNLTQISPSFRLSQPRHLVIQFAVGQAF